MIILLCRDSGRTSNCFSPGTHGKPLFSSLFFEKMWQRNSTINIIMNYWIFHTVGRRPGFRGTANALQGGSTPPPAAKLSAEEENKKIKRL